MALPDLTNLFVADSYKGVLHTANVPLSEANLPPVYDGLGNKSSLRLGSAGNGASVSGCLSADCLTLTGYPSIIDYLYPVGAVYLDTLDVNPQTRFVGTTWVKISDGVFLAGVGTGTDTNGVNKTISPGSNAGEYQHTLTTNEIPAHSHRVRNGTGGENTDTLRDGNGFSGMDSILEYGSYSNIIEETGGSLAHNITPPSFGVYIWKRLT
jgi:hypothetical protein